MTWSNGYTINAHMLASKKIWAIKELRQNAEYFVGLKPAKEAVEIVYNDFINDPARPVPQNSEYAEVAYELEKGYTGRPLRLQNPEQETGPPITCMGKLLAWRAFILCPHRNTLKPLSHRQAEFSIVGKTVDTAPEPEIHNEYGFWAFKNKRQIKEYCQFSDDPFYWQRKGEFPRYVYAVVSLTGTIIEHEIGYRATEIEIVALYSPMNNSMRRNIAYRLGWPGKVLSLADGKESFKNVMTEIPEQES